MTPIDLESEVLKLKQEIESLWLEEAERRDRALDEDPSRAIPAAQVMREARARLS